ncbi:MAG: MmcQ/YjbR family DNA-binding protein [Porphyrobacter sp.]|nr:MmcQ/YjbR family DNA-binding protein [Porphyrobacter sp.]
MSERLDSWEEAMTFALSLPGTEACSSWGKPAVRIAANGRAFLYPGRESGTSFAVAIDMATIELLKETEPETYWQSPHYEGWPAVLVRYDSPDPERVRDVVLRSRDQAAAMKPVRPRKK